LVLALQLSISSILDLNTEFNLSISYDSNLIFSSASLYLTSKTLESFKEMDKLELFYFHSSNSRLVKSNNYDN